MIAKLLLVFAVVFVAQAENKFDANDFKFFLTFSVAEFPLRIAKNKDHIMDCFNKTYIDYKLAMYKFGWRIYNASDIRENQKIFFESREIARDAHTYIFDIALEMFEYPRKLWNFMYTENYNIIAGAMFEYRKKISELLKKFDSQIKYIATRYPDDAKFVEEYFFKRCQEILESTKKSAQSFGKCMIEKTCQSIKKN